LGKRSNFGRLNRPRRSKPVPGPGYGDPARHSRQSQPGRHGNSGKPSRHRLSSQPRRHHRRLNLLSRPPLTRQHRLNRRQEALVGPKTQILQPRRLEQAVSSRPNRPALRLHSPSRLRIRKAKRVRASRISPLPHDLHPSLYSLNHKQLEPDRRPLRTPNRPNPLRLMPAPNLADELTRGPRPLQHRRLTAF
jgi:hypothetical protein